MPAIGRQADRQVRRPLLNADERDVVEAPLVAASVLRVVELLEHAHRQVAAGLQPDREAERRAAIEGADVAEADLGVAVERRRLVRSGRRQRSDRRRSSGRADTGRRCRRSCRPARSARSARSCRWSAGLSVTVRFPLALQRRDDASWRARPCARRSPRRARRAVPADSGDGSGSTGAALPVRPSSPCSGTVLKNAKNW